MPVRHDQIYDEAIDWVVRLRDAGPDGWEAFTAWLEADPAHAAAYEEAALADQDWGELAPPPRRIAPDHVSPVPPFFGAPAPAPSRHGLTRRRWLGGAIAASLIGLVGYGTLAPDRSVYAVETGAGERRSVALADGSRIDLNGSTRLRLDRDAPRFARLEQGEALFTVVHDDRRPFEVEVAGTRLRDMGTVFNVVSDRGSLEVGVAEGAVLYDPDGEAVNLTRGMTLRRDSGGRAQLSNREPEAVAGWRDGRLVYASATVGQVAADLSRNLGVTVATTPVVERQPFTGVIILDPQPQSTIDRAAGLLGVEADRSDEGWILKSGAGETR
ncbi:FecR family protein [Sphingosinicella terrae]|uniref:FecR family protein n=1 Tax=Sphingosinicella terrae TaxID=2172047 RepID=UPI000E0CBF77|nr:FecR domain-containing protein [Sphingosinicella terrae]